MKATLLLVLLSVIFCFKSEARELNKCQLVHELLSHGFPENKMRDWVCLIQNESAGKTHKMGSVNKNGSRDHGLFQINDKYWCSNSGSPGKDCNVTCEDVKTDDITKAAECAKKIYKRHNFRAWYGWRNHCQGTLPDISDC